MKKYLTPLLLLVLLSSHVSHLFAQTAPSLNIGRVSEVNATFAAKATAVKRGLTRGQVVQALPNQSSVLLQVNSSEDDGAGAVYYGQVKDDATSRFFLKVKGNKVSGAIIRLDQKQYYEYSATADGQVYVTEKDIDKVLCVGYQEKHQEVAATLSQAATNGTAAVPVLESLPGAGAVVYLDFDGQTVTGTYWNNGEPIVAEPANLSAVEMVEVWRMMSEDFRPFDLNITTSEAVFNSAPPARRMRVIFTPTSYFNPNAGGVAYIGSFTWGGTSAGETPCWVFNESAKAAGEAGSHEVGHTLYLVHDGRGAPYTEEYYSGHEQWAPIMGTGYTRPVVQWSKGEYPDANNYEDDLQKISTLNGFGYRADDHGNDMATASKLVMGANGEVSAADNRGIISTRADVDVFSFTTGGGAIALAVRPDPHYPNLDILLTLRNAAGDIVATADPAGMEAYLEATLEAGTYYLAVDGTSGALGANSDYASLGEYTVSTKDYCMPVYAEGCSNYATHINSFSFNTLVNNDSGCSNSTANGYTNFPPEGTLTTSVNSDQSYTLLMQSGSLNGEYFGVWIDYNQDKDFDDAGEFVYASPNRETTQLSTTITIPATALPGATRMRVRSGWEAVFESFQSCSEMMYGEAEDYTITVVNPENNVGPTVSLTSPVDGASFAAPATVELAATADDEDGTVAKVEFFQGATKIGEDDTSPYTYRWNGVGPGNYTLTAQATDNKGASTMSAAIHITVSDPANQAPVVTLTSPDHGQKFPYSHKPIKLSADASDAGGRIARVEFFSGNTKLGEDRKAPYKCMWKSANLGTYIITARATDNQGAVTISEPITIEIIASEKKKNNKAASGVLAGESQGGVTVYPNPVGSGNAVNLSLPANFKAINVVVYDLSTGRRVAEQKYTGKQTLQVDVSALPRGIYGLTITAEDQVWIKKLVVMK